MATGIPNINGDKKKKHNSNNFCLQYDGKASLEEILRTQQAQLRCVISVDKQPINRLIYGENLRVISR